jgi:hypothetical protein
MPGRVGLLAHGPVEELGADEARLLGQRIADEMAGWKARLSLLLNTAVQYELDRGGESDGIEVIASVAAMSPAALSKLLAGDYRPVRSTWPRIERILLLCQASRGVERVTVAKRYFDRIAELDAMRDRVLNRRAQLARGRRPDPPPPAPAPDAPEVAPPAEAEGAPPVIPDLRGHEQRPDPLLAKTPAKFVAAMRAYHAWAGRPSYREMERRCAKRISYSTFRNLLAADTLPKLASVEIFVKVVGGSPDDLQAWATAWRRIAMGDFTMIGRERRSPVTPGHYAGGRS